MPSSSAERISSTLPVSGFGASLDAPWPKVSTAIPASASVEAERAGAVDRSFHARKEVAGDIGEDRVGVEDDNAECGRGHRRA